MHNLKTGDMCTPSWNTEIELKIMMIEGDKCTVKNGANLSIVSLSDLKPLPPKTLKLSGEVPVPIELSVCSEGATGSYIAQVKFKAKDDARAFALEIKSLLQDQGL